jgi:hypothetical protein
MSRSTVLALLLAVGLTACGPADEEQGLTDLNCDRCDAATGGNQVIVIAFDGSRAIGMWRDSMAFARQVQAESGKSIHYSYFINTPYYLTDPPANALGIRRGDIPADEALRRWAYTQLAINEGHEIGSHLVGHYNGESWSADRWRQEFDMFDQHVKNRLFQPLRTSAGQPLFPRFACADPLAEECDPVFPVVDEDGTELFDAQGNASAAAIASGRLVPYRMVGVRAPELGWNNAMLDVMAARGFRYDTSQTGQLGWPGRTRGNLWEFPVQMFPRTRSSKQILGMDYNFYVGHLDGAEVEEMYNKVIGRAYAGSRHPVYLCHHFSNWAGPDGVTYWDSLKRSVRNTAKSLDGVRFVSYIELTDMFDAAGAGSGTPQPLPQTQAPFVGTPCTTHDQCADLDGGFCMTYGSSQGFCTIECSSTCPDRTGAAGTFCVASAGLQGVGLPPGDLSDLPAGVCVSKADPANQSCAGIPGTRPTTLPRLNDSSRTSQVCAPGQ